MTFDLSILAKQQRGIGSMLGEVTFTIGSTSVKGWRTVINSDRKAQLYGYDTEVDHSVGCILADLPSDWEDVARVTIDGQERVILGHDLDAGRVSIRLDLGSKYA